MVPDCLQLLVCTTNCKHQHQAKEKNNKNITLCVPAHVNLKYLIKYKWILVQFQ